ncbi:MAG: DNA topoisomerase I [Candidatus Aenigmatarchaeota archaeon]|nr:DNA topoisomerase I [Candidatus Aenigmarchaeota archaeon]
MHQLIHNGILVPKYEPKGFKIKFKGKEIKLTPEQEEMALAWVKKLGTPYVEDPVFVKNFFDDFCKALGVQGNKEDFDFSEIIKYVNEEKMAKEKMSKEEKKALAEQRKKIREQNKEKYGYAIVDGIKVELGNYIAEPSSIFMGRGNHPLRGKWKQGPKQEDIILNLSPDAPRPEGNWKEIVWMPECMWIAKWDDKLTGKEKYVWLADTSFVKQNREKEKFDKAIELGKKYDLLMKHIKDNLTAEDMKTRKIATVCYLIDAVKMRVGDEKDKDEADTVGATTLTTKNVKIKDNNIVVFDFLGKDSVHWHKEVELPNEVINNLKEFMANPGKKGTIFAGVRSENVNEFLSSIVPGVTAKVFRTYHATRTIDDYLSKAKAKEEDSDEYKKYIATLANLQAAIVCNHKRTLPKTWEKSLNKKIESLEKLKKQKEETKKKMEEKIKQKMESYQKRIKDVEEKLVKAKEAGKEKNIKSLEERLKKLNKQMKENKEKMEKSLKEKMEKIQEKIEVMKLKIDVTKQTRDYNLNTSLKSYIDPRVFYRWFKKVDFDWKKYYSKTLQRKFSWIEEEKE